jgi:hypothetical protein
MVSRTDLALAELDLADIPGTSLKVSRVGLGTWAIGGWM